MVFRPLPETVWIQFLADLVVGLMKYAHSAECSPDVISPQRDLRGCDCSDCLAKLEEEDPEKILEAYYERQEAANRAAEEAGITSFPFLFLSNSLL